MKKYPSSADLARILLGILDLPVILPVRELLELVDRRPGVPRVLSAENIAVENVLSGGI